MGANIDAVETAARFGIAKDRAADYLADSEGIGLNYDVVSEAVTDFRAGHPIHANWKEQIDEDYRKRGRKKQRKPR